MAFKPEDLEPAFRKAISKMWDMISNSAVDTYMGPEATTSTYQHLSSLAVKLCRLAVLSSRDRVTVDLCDVRDAVNMHFGNSRLRDIGNHNAINAVNLYASGIFTFKPRKLPRESVSFLTSEVDTLGPDLLTWIAKMASDRSLVLCGNGGQFLVDRLVLMAKRLSFPSWRTAIMRNEPLSVDILKHHVAQALPSKVAFIANFPAYGYTMASGEPLIDQLENNNVETAFASNDVMNQVHQYAVQTLGGVMAGQHSRVAPGMLNQVDTGHGMEIGDSDLGRSTEAMGLYKSALVHSLETVGASVQQNHYSSMDRGARRCLMEMMLKLTERLGGAAVDSVIGCGSNTLTASSMNNTVQGLMLPLDIGKRSTYHAKRRCMEFWNGVQLRQHLLQ